MLGGGPEDCPGKNGFHEKFSGLLGAFFVFDYSLQADVPENRADKKITFA